MLSAIVTILALLFYFYLGFRVGAMRGRHGIKAPAMTGHPEFERAVRVHLNTLEHLVVFLPLLWIATAYFHLVGWLVPAVGLLWLIGRVVYMQGYMRDPDKRETGFTIAAIAMLALLILAIIGLVMAWRATFVA